MNWVLPCIKKNPDIWGHVFNFVREGNGTPLRYSCLENPMDGGAWWAAVHAVARSQTRLSDFTFTFHFHALEKEMATHSSVLAWRIPGMGEPDRMPSMGLHRVGHDWSDLAATAAYLKSSITLLYQKTNKQGSWAITIKHLIFDLSPCYFCYFLDFLRYNWYIVV